MRAPSQSVSKLGAGAARDRLFSGALALPEGLPSLLAPDLRARIEAAVRAIYLSGAPDGPRSLTATAWAVRGLVPG